MSHFGFFVVLLFSSTLLVAQEFPEKLVKVHKYGRHQGLDAQFEQDFRLNQYGILEYFNTVQAQQLINGGYVSLGSLNHPNLENFLLGSNGLSVWNADSLLVSSDLHHWTSAFKLPEELSSFDPVTWLDSALIYTKANSINIWDTRTNKISSLNSDEGNYPIESKNSYRIIGKALHIQLRDSVRLRYLSFDLKHGNKKLRDLSFDSRSALSVVNDSLIVLREDNKLFLISPGASEITSKSLICNNVPVFSTLSSTYWKDQFYILRAGVRFFVLDVKEGLIKSELVDVQRDEFSKSNISKIVLDHKRQLLYSLDPREGIIIIDLKEAKSKWIIPENEELKFAANLVADSSSDMVLYTTWEGNFVALDLKDSVCFKLLSNDGLSLGVYLIEPRKYLVLSKEIQHKIVTYNDSGEFEIEFINSNVGLLHTYFNNELLNDDSTILIYAEDFLIDFNKEKQTITISDLDINKHDATSAFLCKAGLLRPQRNKLFVYDFKNHILKDSLNWKIDRTVRDIYQINEDSFLLACQDGLLETNLVTNRISKTKGISEVIYSLEKVGDAIFLGTNKGVVIYERGRILRRIGIEGDPSSTEFNTGAVTRARDELYFGGVSGIFQVNAKSMLESQDYKVGVHRCVVNGEEESFLYTHEIGDINLNFEPSVESVDLYLFTPTTPIYNSQNYQYAYNRGSKNWVDLGKSNKLGLLLSPGTHRIYLACTEAFNPDLEPSQSMTIHINEFWWRTSVFKICVSAMILSIPFWLFWRHKRRIQLEELRIMRLKEKFSEERLRISQDLHDNIGMQTSILRRSLVFLKQNINSVSSDKMQKTLSSLEDISTDLNRELRDTIWASEKNQMIFDDLIHRLQTIIYRLKLHSPCNINIIKEEHAGDQNYSSETILNAFRITQEAIHNSIKHSQAEDLTIRIFQVEHNNTIEIKDNGIGFTNSATEGYGLENMKDRAQKTGIRLTIDSKLNSYACITITLPPLLN